MIDQFCIKVIILLYDLLEGIYVDDLKAERKGLIKTFKEEKDPKYPENYQTCINYFRVFRKLIQLFGMWIKSILFKLQKYLSQDWL